MASIIEFKRRPQMLEARLGGDVKTGQILLFTGVRYERAPSRDQKDNWTPTGWTAPLQPNPAHR